MEEEAQQANHDDAADPKVDSTKAASTKASTSAAFIASIFDVVA